MALDAALQTQNYPMGYFCKDFSGAGAGGFKLQERKGFLKLLGGGVEPAGSWDFHSASSSSAMQNVKEYWDPNSSPEVYAGDRKVQFLEEDPRRRAVTPAALGKRKRQRSRASKNREELENQRMTHIAVERNRRKQMNEYLAVIKSLMPPSYVQRGDQASIIGGAINFVKELEQHLQSLEALKKNAVSGEEETVPPVFADFFSFPQYTTGAGAGEYSDEVPAEEEEAAGKKKWSGVADIEVSMAESHANLKILSRKRPRQLLKLVSGLQCLWFTVLHLNVTTTFDQKVLYSISVKLEEGCRLTTVDEIADAVNHLLERIEEEAV